MASDQDTSCLLCTVCLFCARLVHSLTCLYFVGIGEAMFSQSDSPVPSIQACTEKFKTMSLESTHPIIEEDAFDIGYRSESGELRMVEYLAIEWWDAVHGDDQDITKQMKQITAPTVPLMRQFGNSAAMDILVVFVFFYCA